MSHAPDDLGGVVYFSSPYIRQRLKDPGVRVVSIPVAVWRDPSNPGYHDVKVKAQALPRDLKDVLFEWTEVDVDALSPVRPVPEIELA